MKQIYTRERLLHILFALIVCIPLILWLSSGQWLSVLEVLGIGLILAPLAEHLFAERVKANDE